MSIEPQIKTRSILAGMYGASASCFVLIILFVFLVLSTRLPEDDGSVRGVAIAFGFVVPIWIILFVYFLAFSFKVKNTVKFMFKAQMLWVTILAFHLGYIALRHEGWASALPVFGITFLLFNVVLTAGALCCRLAK